jgi:hypothetical protein
MNGAKMQGAKMEELKHGGNGVPGLVGSSFDIFQVEVEGVVWRGVAPTFAEASRRVQELASASPTDYIIWNRNTGDKHTIKSGSGQDGAGSKRTQS